MTIGQQMVSVKNTKKMIKTLEDAIDNLIPDNDVV